MSNEKTILQIDDAGCEVARFSCAAKVSQVARLPIHVVRGVCRAGEKTLGYHWRYATEEEAPEEEWRDKSFIGDESCVFAEVRKSKIRCSILSELQCENCSYYKNNCDYERTLEGIRKKAANNVTA